MPIDEQLLFSGKPIELSLYETVRDKICSSFEFVNVKAHKTQVTFSNKHGFAFVSLPLRKVKNLPEHYIFVTFGLAYHLENPRIFRAVEPYPNRWTHHVVVQNPDEMDGQLMGWIKEAYEFALVK